MSKKAYTILSTRKSSHWEESKNVAAYLEAAVEDIKQRKRQLTFCMKKTAKEEQAILLKGLNVDMVIVNINKNTC